jgi:hypothetical protein
MNYLAPNSKLINKLLIVGTVAFDAIETFGKTDKILGGRELYRTFRFF